MPTAKITCCVITLNASKTLAKTLSSIKTLVDEIVIVDSGSTDETKDIAARFGAKFITNTFRGFGEQKNFCINQATYDWIFSLDADEFVSGEFLKEVASLDLDSEDVSFRIRRQNYIGESPIRYSGWQNDWVIRLFNRKTTQFLDLPVHESVSPTKYVKTLKAHITHLPANTFLDLERKNMAYGLKAFESRVARGISKLNLSLTLLKASWAFFRCFVVQRGAMDGIAGLQIAKIRFHYTTIKYRGSSFSRRINQLI